MYTFGPTERCELSDERISSNDSLPKYEIKV